MDSVSDVAHAGVNLDSDIAHAGVDLASRKRRRRRRRRRWQNRLGVDPKVVQNINQVNQHVEYSLYPNICITAGGRIQGTITEVDSAVRLNAENQRLVRVATTHPLEKTVESGNDISRGMVINKADPINGSPGMDHISIISKLSLQDASDGLTDARSTKTMVIPQDSGFFAGKESSICASQHVNGMDDPSEFVSSDVFNGANLCFVPRFLANRSPVVCMRRKLLVLDINGLLADIVMPPPLDFQADRHISGRAIFKRPFYHDFLMFCFERFDVGIWSSRSKRIIDKVVEYLLGDLKHKLLFCWNMLHCTETKFKTLENKHKPLVFKELSKLWEKHHPDLPWEKGDYNESNTVLLDDSPYKALLNPIHTAIFPDSFHYGDKKDNSLGRGGDLRVYLEGLATTDNVQNYIEQHPFGQGAIDERSSLWSFYSKDDDISLTKLRSPKSPNKEVIPQRGGWDTGFDVTHDLGIGDGWGCHACINRLGTCPTG